MTQFRYLLDSPHVSDWVAVRCGLESRADFGPHHSLGICADRRPVCGVIYADIHQHPHGKFTTCSIAAVRGYPWAKREALEFIFKFAFDHMECTKMIALVREGNQASAKMCRHMGFRKEGVLRQHWDGKTNAILYGMLKSECRYLNNEQKKQAIDA